MHDNPALMRVGGLVLAAFGFAVMGTGALLVMALMGRPLPTDQLGAWADTFFRTVTAGAVRPVEGAMVEGLMQSTPGFWSLVLLVAGAIFVALGAIQALTGRSSRTARGIVVMLVIAFPLAVLTMG